MKKLIFFTKYFSTARKNHVSWKAGKNKYRNGGFVSPHRVV